MPRPLTISEVARRLGRNRLTVRRRVKALGMEFTGQMSPEQFRRLKRSFATVPKLPQGTLR